MAFFFFRRWDPKGVKVFRFTTEWMNIKIAKIKIKIENRNGIKIENKIEIKLEMKLKLKIEIEIETQIEIEN